MGDAGVRRKRKDKIKNKANSESLREKLHELIKSNKATVAQGLQEKMELAKKK
jgi:hypothetical protein